MVDQRQLQISELHFDKFPTPSTFSLLEEKIQNPSKCLFQFALGGNVMEGTLTSRILRCWMRGLRPRSEQDQNSYFKKKVSLEEQKAQKEVGFYEEDRSLT